MVLKKWLWYVKNWQSFFLYPVENESFSNLIQRKHMITCTYLKTRQNSPLDERNPETFPPTGQKIQHFSSAGKYDKNK